MSQVRQQDDSGQCDRRQCAHEHPQPSLIFHAEEVHGVLQANGTVDDDTAGKDQRIVGNDQLRLKPDDHPGHDVQRTEGNLKIMFLQIIFAKKVDEDGKGQMESFIPANTLLLEKEPKYREIISSIGSKFHNSPSQLPLMLGEVNLVLGSLYPKINQYIDEPDSFASDLVSFLQRKDGRSHQKLLEKIYKYLPQ